MQTQAIDPKKRVESLMREKNLTVGSRVKIILDPPYEGIAEWAGQITSLWGGIHLNFVGDKKLAIPWKAVKEIDAA